MNMHGPQNVMAETELKHLAATVQQIITPASNSPIIGMYQDSLLGAYRFTREKIDLTPRQAMNLLMAYKNIDIDALLSLEGKITNFDVLSQIMPHITMTIKNKLMGENEDFATTNNVMEIRNGKYVRGHMEKSVLGSTTNGIIHRAFNDFGPDRAAAFIDDLQAIVTEYMKTSSYSVGISDLLADKNTMTQITSTIATQKMEAKKLMDSVHLGIFKNETANSNAAEFENQITNIMKKADNDAGKIGSKSLSKNNRFLMIVNSGSKGNMINISQMISCLGQQAVEGKRIPYGLDSRTLPHYFKYDDSPGARGYIENSYISGLTAPELFFHAMGGRIGLIDTAVKSVSWETPIVLIDNGRPLYTEIGRWIDGIIDVSEQVKKYEEKNMELVDIPNGTVFVPTMNEHGEVTWEEITAVTRHDPGNVLYQIKSLGGREVIVTESKSLLIWNKEKGIFEEILTPDIRVGDCLPVTMELCEPPVVLNEIDVSAYLPKNKYVYGSDFNKATQMMNSAMEGREKIPAGWWNEHNGKDFVLPYTKKSSLQRTNVRSNTDVIMDGYIYPYHAQRIDSKMPEKFELNFENGQFIGLFLADGHAYESAVYITKNNENVQTFVKTWFENHGISYEVRDNQNKVGKSTSICGHSGVLANLLNGLVGKGAAEKHVPTEAFIANIEFVKGMLSGYFSGDGTVSKNSVEACSSSKRLIEGISMLCSRIGVFCKVFSTQLKRNNLGTKNIRPSYRISIRANWGRTFAENIQLIENNKQAKLSAIRWGDAHINFAHHNNVVLDPIVSITPLSPEKYPKMYDLTIPKTLNFGIANGLQVRDTSSTGYIQRRLIKGLEDLKVEYDMTVRNSNGKIVQFAYGDDGFDSTKVENQQIPLAGMSVEDVYMMYDIARITDKERGSKDIYTPAIVNKIRGEVEETRKKCRQYIDRMLADREELVKNVFKYKDDAGVKVPVAFKHIINNVAGSMGLDAHSMVDITPLETFIMVEEYFHKLEKLHYVRPTNLFRIMYYFYLNPRDLLCVKRYNKAALTVLLETIVLKYKQAVVNPGDMVGVIAGQSIGEPTTQLTLNSFVYETEILVRNAKGEIKCVQIGDFAKWGIDTSRKIEYMDAKDTTYAELCEFYEVPSATEDGRTVWRRIEAVTKHPVINEDGTNTMLKVTTKGQREIIATKAKSFLQLIDGKIVGVNGSELQVGDYLPVSKKALDFTERNSFDLREILSPKEYIYGTEMEKARSHMHEYHWWMKHAGKSFVLPYARSDSAYVALNGGHNKGYKTQFVYKPGCVYTTTNSIGNYEIPETMPLDYDFGYLIGAYCAEGCMTKHQVSIANNVNEYLAPIERWCAKHNLTTKIYCHKNKIQEGWTSQDIRIYNTVLCRILDKLCGKLSHNKFVSDIIMFSNRECILGFLDAYISGDGCVNKDQNGRIKDIAMSSVSHRMLTQVQVMLKNIGVISKMHKCPKQETNNRGSKDIKQGYLLRVANKQSQKLASLLNLSIDYKRERIAKLLTQDFKYDYCGSDLQIPNIINGETIMQARDGRCSDLEFDQIISIEEVPNTTPYAYDLTVEDTRNFDCMNGLAQRDTFHLAGVSSKSNVTRGVPRIEEILNLTKSQKSTSLTVHLKPMDEQHMDRAVKYAKMLEHTKLADVVKSMQICFDPAEDDTRIADDREFMRQFIEFERMMEECGAETSMSEKSKWVLRMEMDEETMLDKNITMDDVHFALKNSTLGQDITCSYSDYNSDKLVFRIRSSTFGQSKKKTKNAPASLDLSDDISMLRSYQDSILNSVVLRGVTGIVNVLPRKLQNMVDKEDGKYVRKDMWVLDTTGTNLLDTLALDYIDPYRTYSNDIKEVFDVLGIDAARQTIFDEMTDVMEASDVYINYHHLSLLCDRMTLTKGMVSIYRTGILSDDIGPVAKSTFEVHTKVLLDAARRAEFDHIRGVSANVMCGQQGLYGTNAFQVVLDMKAMSKIEDTMVDVQTDDVEKMMAEMGLGTEDGCVSKIKNNIKYLNRENTGECDDNYDMGF